MSILYQPANVKKATVLFIGMAGSGKSTVLNAITQSKNYKVSSGANQCTLQSCLRQEVIEGNIMYAIDTPGFGIDNQNTENEIYDLIKNWELGITVIVIVVPYCRIFHKDTMNLLKFAVDLYKNDGKKDDKQKDEIEIEYHICFMFTFWPENPSDEMRSTQKHRNYLKTITGRENVMDIASFVFSTDENVQKLTDEYLRDFRKYIFTINPLEREKVKRAHFGYEEQIIIESIPCGIRYEKNKLFQVFDDVQKIAYIPNDGGKITYSEDIIHNERTEVIEKTFKEKEKNLKRNEIKGDNLITITFDRYRIVSYNYKDAKKIYRTGWIEIIKNTSFMKYKTYTLETNDDEEEYKETTSSIIVKHLYLKRYKIENLNGEISYTDWEEYKQSELKLIPKFSSII